jgi:hypothetical protein
MLTSLEPRVDILETGVRTGPDRSGGDVGGTVFRALSHFEPGNVLILWRRRIGRCPAHAGTA